MAVDWGEPEEMVYDGKTMTIAKGSEVVTVSLDGNDDLDASP